MPRSRKTLGELAERERHVSAAYGTVWERLRPTLTNLLKVENLPPDWNKREELHAIVKSALGISQGVPGSAFALRRSLLRALGRPATLSLLTMASQISNSPYRLELRKRRRSEFTSGWDRSERRLREARDEIIAYAILERTTQGASLADACVDMAIEGAFGLGDEALRKAFHRHIKRAEEFGVLFPNWPHALTQHYLPPRFTFADLPVAGRPKIRQHDVGRRP